MMFVHIHGFHSLAKSVKWELCRVLLQKKVAARPKPRCGILCARGGKLWTAKLGTCARDDVKVF